MQHRSQPAAHRPRRLVALRRHLTWRHLLMVAGAVVLSLGMEALVTAAITFFDYRFGFWWGLVDFTATWLFAGLGVLLVTARLWAASLRAERDRVLTHSAIGRRIAWVARRARLPAALLVAWFFGPLQAPPAFLALGYRGGELAAWEIVSAPIFCSFWFAWAVGAFHLGRVLLARLL